MENLLHVKEIPTFPKVIAQEAEARLELFV